MYLEFVAIGSSLEVLATIGIRIYGGDDGIIDTTCTVVISIKRYNIGPDYIPKYIATSNTPTL